jgi:type IV secretion system protein VirB11
MASSPSTATTSSVPAKDTALRQLLRPLALLLEDRSVTELALNRPQEAWAMRGGRWERHELLELTADFLRTLTTAVAVYNGLPEESILSAILPDGERCQIIREPACVPGWTSVTIRKHAPPTLSLDELAAQGIFESTRDVSFNRPSAEEAMSKLEARGAERLEDWEVDLLGLKREGRLVEFCREAVQRRCNIVIAGQTGSGKTTLARALVAQVPTEERVVTIEDVHEMELPSHPNRVPLIFGGGEGRVTADACLAACMRLTPDRIFLAELRGGETWAYVISLNTGHPGSVTTTHANSATLTIERIATLIKNSPAGQTLDLADVRRVLRATLHVVLFMERYRVKQLFYDPIYQRSQTD